MEDKKYAVIFTAQMTNPDKEYYATAKKMRELAINQYGCTDFTSVFEDSNEITVSYWENLEQINAWKQDIEHLKAQNMGKSKWYKTYRVQVVEVLREYSSHL
ncbi:MAG: antibiotic biosynthesis monooxygenase [endosymbiont of Galathealinum brachiosum]|uniref:Antibiotic biosynthesis monooxygenase n=1 Tax=endosymbiont of Galathealinum brachiosum TaxID=2200906 RepID=A0A370D6Z7_9GAMM|nr:MAG: antibiotic biosynthesis monooxygenase [endosymbiont of Galathealinum brachiosum]